MGTAPSSISRPSQVSYHRTPSAEEEARVGGSNRGRWIQMRSNADEGTVAATEEEEVVDDIEQASSRRTVVGNRQGMGGWFETYFGSLSVRPQSLTIVIVAIQVMLYIIASMVLEPRGWITPSPPVLQRLGASDYKAERCFLLYGLPYLWEARRFFMPILLHLSIPHLLFNASFELASGVRLEAQLGTLRFSVLFLGSGICGNLLSSAGRVSGVGASTACYGLIGADLAVSWIMWPHFDEELKVRAMQQLKAMAIGLMMWEMLLHGAVDHLGHLGGLIGGLSIMPLIVLRSNTVDDHRLRITRFVGGFALTAVIIICLAAIILAGRAAHGSAEDDYCAKLYNR